MVTQKTGRMRARFFDDVAVPTYIQCKSDSLQNGRFVLQSRKSWCNTAAGVLSFSSRSRHWPLQFLVSRRSSLPDSLDFFQAHQGVECLGNSWTSRTRCTRDSSRRRFINFLYIFPNSKLLRREKPLQVLL